MTIPEAIQAAITVLEAAKTPENEFMKDVNFGVTHSSRDAHEAALAILSPVRSAAEHPATRMSAAEFWAHYNFIDAAYDAVTHSEFWGYSEVEYTIKHLNEVLARNA